MEAVKEMVDCMKTALEYAQQILVAMQQYMKAYMDRSVVSYSHDLGIEMLIGTSSDSTPGCGNIGC